MTSTNIKQHEIQQIDDTKTGLLNEKILLNTNKLQYESTNTYLSKQRDQAELTKYEGFKDQLFQYLAQMNNGTPALQDITAYIVSDIEYCITDRKSGKQKRELAYQSILQFIKLINNSTYDTFNKETILKEIDQQFKKHKHDYLRLCAEIHDGIKMATKIVWNCVNNQ